jgi:hypothetical protein
VVHNSLRHFIYDQFYGALELTAGAAAEKEDDDQNGQRNSQQPEKQQGNSTGKALAFFRRYEFHEVLSVNWF